MEFVSSCQTDDLTLIKGDDMTMLLQAIIFVSPLPKKLIRIYTRIPTSSLLFLNVYFMEWFRLEGTSKCLHLKLHKAGSGARSDKVA